MNYKKKNKRNFSNWKCLQFKTNILKKKKQIIKIFKEAQKKNNKNEFQIPKEKFKYYKEI